MELKKLDSSFYADNERVEQALDFHSDTGSWDTSKIRGHGIVKVVINDLTFAIPVRSNVRHDASYILQKNTKQRHIKGMGLDYSKALLIKDEKHVSDELFLLRKKSAGKKLIGKEAHVTKKFQNYVEKYIKSVQKDDQNVLNDEEYKYTTLVNYHSELGL